MEPEKFKHLGPFFPQFERDRHFSISRAGLGKNDVILNLFGVLKFLGVHYANPLTNGPASDCFTSPDF